MTDTSPAASKAYSQRLSEMSPAERINLGLALCEAGNALQRAGMRVKYPDADNAEITFRIAVTRFGEELARKAYGRQ